MFTSFPTYSRYRTLSLTSPAMRGEDVFALQTALNHCGFNCGTADGILGQRTADAIRKAQSDLGLVSDGKAGGLTQRGLALRISKEECAKRYIPEEALKGQLEHESGFRLGNYSPQRSNGSYDAGVAQRNTQHTLAELGFHVPNSIAALAVIVREHYNLFAGVGDKRRWQLAQGAWNAPAFACYIAREEGAKIVTRTMTRQPTTEQRETFEAYMAHVSTYYI